MASESKLLEYAKAAGSPCHSKEDALKVGKVVAIFKNNNTETSVFTHAFFKDAARLNHSCIPNTTYAYYDDTGVYIVRAAKDIRMNEEILDSYASEIATKIERDRSLRRYDFVCTCKY